MIYNNKKHFYDPYDSLDAEWKARISHEMLSVGEADQLFGFSRQYINKLIANGIIDAKKNYWCPLKFKSASKAHLQCR